MYYISTRGNYERVESAPAIKLGMVPVGGLFVPETAPVIKPEEIFALAGGGYREVAEKIISLYLTDYLAEEIRDCIDKAYSTANFDTPDIAPLVKIDETMSILELWHGPTAAFKDMALQIMPHFLSKAIKKLDTGKEVVILVATSGDTGKAALEGFKNVPGIKIICFYPHGGVSKVQELQMATTDGNNTYVVAVKGNFDDCQNAVKEIFGSRVFNEALIADGYELSSANSINWGRLLPQIVYYFWAYLGLLDRREIAPGEKVNFVVPTGNFGNILAGYYAYRMGLPVHKLICASNENKVLTDFFTTGEYDRRREFKQTVSPSMDILISSNLERFLFEVTGHDATKINQWFKELNEAGSFRIDTETKGKIDEILSAGFATEPETMAAIKTLFTEHRYTLDTHTAVGVKVYRDYLAATGDRTKTVVDATASPFKFNTSVLQAIAGEAALTGLDDFAMLEKLSEVAGMEIHPGLRGLDKKPVLHTAVSEKENIRDEIEKILK